MQRTKILRVRVTEDEYKRLQNKARSLLGRDNISAFIRKKTLSSDLSTEEMVSALYKRIILKKGGQDD